jgi:small subunit ribosomal protein S18
MAMIAKKKKISKDKYRLKKKSCYFTDKKIEKIDFKDIELLQKFIGNNGKILPRSFTGTSAIWQRKLAIAIKRARHMALLPFVKD